MANSKPPSGDNIATVGLGLDTDQLNAALEESGQKLDNFVGKFDQAGAKIGTATIVSVKAVKDLGNSVSGAGDSFAKFERDMQAAMQVEKDMLRAQELLSNSQTQLIVKLNDLVKTYGLTTEQLYRLQAAELGVAKEAESLIVKLETLKTATAQYGREITDLASIEKARIEFETNAQTVFLAFKRRTLAENAAAEEAAATSLAAQRRRALAEQAQEEESAATVLAAFKRRTMAENRAAAIKDIEEMHALRLKADENEKTRLAIFNAFKTRTMAENRAEAMRILTEQEEAAVALAEKQAIEEIKWGRMSVAGRVAELERLKAYQANPAISSKTVESSFSSAAIKDIGNLTKLQEELNAAQSRGHGTTRKLGEEVGVLGGLMGSTKVKTEGLVLAHEAYLGQSKRFVGSLMVMAEYITQTGASLIGMTGVVIALAAAFIGLAVVMIKGLHEQKEMQDALIMTGNYAGRTAEQLNTMAHEAAGAHGSIGEAKEAVIQLAASGRFTGEQISMVAASVVELEHATGQSIDKTIKQFESLAVQAGGQTTKMADHISNNLLKLNDQYHFLTVAVYEQVRAMEREGDQMGASKLAMETFADVIRSRAAESVENLGHIESAWKAIKKAIGDAIDQAGNWGKTQGPSARINELTKTKTALETGGYGMIPGVANREQAALKLIEVNRDLAQATLELNRVQERANEQSATAQKNEAALYAVKTVTNQMTQLQKKSQGELTTKLEEYAHNIALIKGENPNSILVTPEAVERGIAAITKAYTATAKAHSDGRKVELATLTDAAKQEFKLVEETEKEKIKLYTDAHNKKQMDDETYYAKVRESLATETKALEKEYAAQIKALETYKPKKGDMVDAARVVKELQSVTAAYKLEKQKIEGAGTLIDQQEQEAAIKKLADVMKAIDKEGQHAIKDLDEKIAKQRQHNLEIGKSKAQIDLLRAAEELEGQKSVKIEAEAIRLLIAQEGLEGNMLTIYAARLAYLDQEIAKTSTLAALKAEAAPLDDAVQKLANQEAAAKQAAEYWKLAGSEIGEALAAGFNSGIEALAKLGIAATSYFEHQAVLEKELAQAKKIALSENDPNKMAKALQQYADDTAKNQIRAYADMASAAKGFFKEGTTGYKLMEAAEKAFRLYQLVMDAQVFAKKMGFLAAEETATITFSEVRISAAAAGATAEIGAATATAAAEGATIPVKVASGASSMFAQSGWFAFAGIAAMLAVMAGLGFGGGSTGTPAMSSEQRQEQQGTGSVFGDETAKSKSIENSLSILETNSNIALDQTNQMLVALHSIRDNILGVVNAVLHTTGLRGGAQDIMGLGIGSSKGAFGFSSSSKELVDQGIVVGSYGTVQVPHERQVRNQFGAEGGEGEGTTETYYTTETKFNPQTIGQVRQNKSLEGSKYSSTHEEESSWWGLSQSSTDETIYKELDKSIKRQMGLTVLSIADGVQSAAVSLGANEEEVRKKIDAFNVDIGLISLKGLKGQELQDELNAVFSKFGDDLAASVMPGLDDFQKVGEGYMETLFRVATGVDKAKFALEQLGITAIDYTQIINKQGNVTAEIIRQSIHNFETKPGDTVTLANGNSVTGSGTTSGIGKIIDTFTGSDDDMVSLYNTLVKMRDAMKHADLAGADITKTMIRAAGSVEALQEGINTYYDRFFTEEQKKAKTQEDLTASFEKLGIVMPTSKQGFKDLVNGIDRTTEEGQTLFAKVMLLAGGFADAAEAAEAAAQAIDKANAESRKATTQAMQTALSPFKKAKTQDQLIGEQSSTLFTMETLTGFNNLDQVLNLTDAEVAGLSDTQRAAITAYANAKKAAQDYNDALNAAVLTYEEAVAKNKGATDMEIAQLHKTNAFNAMVGAGVDGIHNMAEATDEAYVASLHLAPAQYALVTAYVNSDTAVNSLTDTLNKNAQAAYQAQQSLASQQIDEDIKAFVTKMGLVDEAIKDASGGDSGVEMSKKIAYLQGLKALEEQKAVAILATSPNGTNYAPYIAAQQNISLAAEALANLTRDYQLYVQFEAQYAGHGKELVDLENWHREQRNAAMGNAAALAIIEEAYEKKRLAIINGGVSTGLQQTAEQIKNWVQSLKDWLKNNLLDSSLSPLTASQRLAEAKKQYEDDLVLAKAGDVAARERITKEADAYETEAIAMFGKASFQYRAIFDTIREQIEGLVLDNGGTLDVPAATLDAINVGNDFLQTLTVLGEQANAMQADFISAMSAMTGESIASPDNVFKPGNEFSTGDSTKPSLVTTQLWEQLIEEVTLLRQAVDNGTKMTGKGAEFVAAAVDEAATKIVDGKAGTIRITKNGAMSNG